MAPVTAIYAALLGLLYVLLSVRVIRIRRASKIALGTGGQASLERVVRAHGNFAEYVPLALVFILLAELGGTAAWLLHGTGLLLLSGRIAHAFGVSREPEDYRFRVVGMALTFAALVIAALLALFGAYSGRG